MEQSHSEYACEWIIEGGYKGILEQADKYFGVFNIFEMVGEEQEDIQGYGDVEEYLILVFSCQGKYYDDNHVGNELDDINRCLFAIYIVGMIELIFDLRTFSQDVEYFCIGKKTGYNHRNNIKFCVG